MIRRTDTHADLDAMRTVLERVYPPFDGQGQLSVTCRADAEDRLHDIGWLPDGARDSDYTVINPEFRGTVVEELPDKLPFPYGRTRLMRMAPKSFDDAPHRLQLSSCPTNRLRDLYEP